MRGAAYRHRSESRETEHGRYVHVMQYGQSRVPVSVRVLSSVQSGESRHAWRRRKHRERGHCGVVECQGLPCFHNICDRLACVDCGWLRRGHTDSHTRRVAAVVCPALPACLCIPSIKARDKDSTRVARLEASKQVQEQQTASKKAHTTR